ncbi:MAG: hypothetical protein QXO93_05175 [Acidilobaceae archaeon]
MGKCLKYVILKGYVREDKVLVRFLRFIEDASGKVIEVDEFNRRVICVVPVSKFNDIVDTIIDYTRGYSFNVKASCSVDSISSIEHNIKSIGFFLRVGLNMYYVLVCGRVVEVVFKRNNINIKVGAPRNTLPKPPIPPSLFIFDDHSIAYAIKDLDEIIKVLGLA